MKKKENVSCIAVFQISFQPTGSRSEAWREGNQKYKDQGKELIQPASCVYLYLQGNKRGTPKNRFTYKTLCRCRMKKKCRKVANEKNRFLVIKGHIESRNELKVTQFT